MKSVKKVVYHAHTGKPIITVRVAGHNRLLNAPRHKISQSMKWDE